MKRLPITPEERLFLQRIEKTAMVFLLMFKIYPTPINSDNLAFEMKWDSRRSKKMLDELSSDGFTALMKGQGYVLTSQARGMVAEFFSNLISLPLEAQALAQGSQAQALSGQVLETTHVTVAQDESTHSVRALVVGDSLTTDLKTDLTTTPTQVAQNVQWPSVEKILAATPILFGMPGVVRGSLPLDDMLPHHMLAVLAHCYDLRQTRTNPKGLIKPANMAYVMLRDDKQPREVYSEDPLAYFPDKFLEVLGLLAQSAHGCSLCGKKYATQEELQDHQLTCEPATKSVVQAVSLSVVDDVSPVLLHDGINAWEQVKSQLRTEMPRASFDTWVEHAELVSFAEGVLKIGVRNDYAREWLESRLTQFVERLLIGILNRDDVTVQFVVHTGTSQ